MLRGDFQSSDQLTIVLTCRLLWGLAGLVRAEITGHKIKHFNNKRPIRGRVPPGEDMGDVGGEQVVHLVSEAGLEHQLGVGAAVPDREVEEAGPGHPVDDVAEGQRRQQVLGVKCYVFRGLGGEGTSSYCF